MPVRLCPNCGGTPRACRCRRPPPPARRGYSDTAAYRQMLRDVLEVYGDACHYCRLPTTDPAICAERGPLELAHVIAHEDGGPFELDNLRASHRSCNRRAGRGTPTTPGGRSTNG